MKYDEVHAIEEFNPGPYQVNASAIKQKDQDQRIDFAAIQPKSDEKLKLLFINGQEPAGFDAKINKAVYD